MQANDTNFQHFSSVNVPISNYSLHPALIPYTETFLPVTVDLLGTSKSGIFSVKVVATFTVA
jgi:hypothetical protein